MSTISIAGPSGVVAPRTRLRATARGRRVLAALTALLAAATLCAAILAGGAALASDDVAAPAGSFVTVTVQPGDSLWSIAADVAPAADPRDVVDEIVRLNALDGGSIVPGQQLALPPAYTP